MSSDKWQPISTAPKDGSEINGYRPDQGVFTFRWASMDELVAKNLEGDPIEEYTDFEWWFHDRWGWMERELTPTHWQPLPPPPEGA